MRRFIAVIFNILAFSFALYSQNNLNASAESIIGEYEVRHQGELSHVKVTEDTDGTFRAQVFWVEDRLDDDGNVRLDSKNPDKSLRHVVCDEIVLFSGLKYDSFLVF
ncbi:MAG: hypothetical protein IJ005_03085 [Bacteroidales bacterium]|nr:hypothetical protein [Bacteroidales bacterium]